MTIDIAEIFRWSTPNHVIDVRSYAALMNKYVIKIRWTKIASLSYTYYILLFRYCYFAD